MTTDSIKKTNAADIAAKNNAAANGEDVSTGAILDAERMIKVADIADRMTDEEWERIHQVPIWTNDVRCLADIKAKYRISWNELRTLRSVQR